MSKGKTNQTEKKEYAPSVGLWPAKNGSGKSLGSVFITKAVLETLSKAEDGGRLVLQAVDDKYAKYDDEGNRTTPSYRIAIYAPDENNSKGL